MESESVTVTEKKILQAVSDLINEEKEDKAI